MRCRQAETLRNPEFREFVREICGQILEGGASHVARKDVPWETIRAEERTHRAEAEGNFASSERIDDHILDRMSAWYARICLLEQPYRKDPSRVVGQVLEGLQHSLGDQIEIQRFSRYDITDERKS